MRTSLKRAKSYWRQHGTLALAKKVVLSICSFVFSYRPFYIYEIEGLPETEVKARCPLEIRKGGSEDIDLIVDLLDYWNEENLRKRAKYILDNNGKMFLAFSEGKLVHITWWFRSPGIRQAYFFVKIKPDEAYVFGSYTHPEFRGKNIYPAVLQHVLRYKADKNIKKCFLATIPSNPASIKGIKKAGFSFVGKRRIFRLFGKFFNNQLSLSSHS